MRILIRIDAKNGVPVYLQLKEGMKLAILQGVYPPETKLPTVRQLAVELRINSNTVARAYSELEREGIISTQQGRGTFVCALPLEQGDTEKEKQLDKLLSAFITEAFSLGFSKGQILVRVKEKMTER